MSVGSWFTVEIIDEHTLIIREDGHREQMKSYFLTGQTCAALIDTGLGIGNIKEVVDSLFDGDIVVITTHAHFDHTGGHQYFKHLVIHRQEQLQEFSNKTMNLDELRSKLMKGPITKPLPDSFVIQNYHPFSGDYNEIINSDTAYMVGMRPLQLLHTPGHTKGHLCIYEQNTGYLFCGDLLYKGVILINDLVAYKQSLEKVMGLPKIERIFPSHNEPMENKDIIDQIYSSVCALIEAKTGNGFFSYDDFSLLVK